MHLQAVVGVLWAFIMGRKWAPKKRWRIQRYQQQIGSGGLVLSLDDVINPGDQIDIFLDCEENSEATATVVVSEEDIPGLTYRIPKFLWEKILNSEKQVYWSHTYYRNAAGHPLKVSYATTFEESEAIAKRFLNAKVLGFDMEWKFPNKGGGIKENISLIQVSSDTEIGLFHIARHKGSTTEQLLAPSLRSIIENRDIIKTGVAVYSADGKRLEKFMKINPKGFFELSHLFRLVKYSEKEPKKCNKTLVAFAQQVEEHLGFPMFKGSVRTSDWTKPLDQAQQDYAAADAYAGYVLYHVMEAKRLKLDPIPPRPELAELYRPIRLADKVVVEDDEGDEEREDELNEEDEESESSSSDEDEIEALQQSQQAPERQPIRSKRSNTPKKKKGKRTLIKTSGSGNAIADLDPLGVQIYDALCASRLRSAKTRSTKPYMIAANSVFGAIATLRPTDMIGLEQIKGVGPVKCAKYGEEWLDTVTRTVNARDPALLPVSPHRHDSFSVPDELHQPTRRRPPFRMPPPLRVSEDLKDTVEPERRASAALARLDPPQLSPVANRRVSTPTPSFSPPTLQPSQSSPASFHIPSSQPKAEDPAIQQLHSALSKLRLQLSKTATKSPYDICSEDTLKALATRRPNTIGEICRIPGAGKLLVATKTAGVDLLAFMATSISSSGTTASTSDTTAGATPSPLPSRIGPTTNVLPIRERTPLTETPPSVTNVNTSAKRSEDFTTEVSAKKPRVEYANVTISAEDMAQFLDEVSQDAIDEFDESIWDDMSDVDVNDL
ncbi:hypothetical protein EJ08DRAFT_621042 [Tothia fuscella]|uniref:HRDC domain-containing protein n=1 Tax=Tothia fuscella TaxID=1048955 RepID=A0A9P4NG50_9PEZI|nr:hypothetical protein EJ08DRAFT_621042 [Tothia fuscella]